jgi:hypothetical protein
MIAIGSGLAVFLGKVAEINQNPYVQAACLAGVSTLLLLGAGVAKRSDP